jgi:tetratricopeptide (TPR) repeat protein
MTRLFLLLLLACTLFAARPAAGQEPQDLARQKFSEAVAAHQKGDFKQAAALFEEAYRLVPASRAKYNAAVSWDAAGESPRAADAYATALDLGGLTVEEAEQTRERLSTLERSLGYLQIDEPVGALVSVAHVERAAVPLRVHLVAGMYAVRLELDGVVKTHEVQIGAGEAKRIALEVPRQAAPKAAPAPAAEPVRVPPPEPDRPAPETDSTQRTWGWVAVGVGAALTGAAVVLGLQTLSARDEWDNLAHTPSEIDKRDRAVALRTWTNVAWGSAAVAGGVGVTLLLTAPKVQF